MTAWHDIYNHAHFLTSVDHKVIHKLSTGLQIQNKCLTFDLSHLITSKPHMATKGAFSAKKVQTRWAISEHILKKVAVYKSAHGISNLETAANMLLEKATKDVKLPE